MKNQYNESSFAELIESNRIYQFFTDKIDLPLDLYNKPIKDVCHEMDLDKNLINSLLQSYDDNYEFPYDELNTFSITDLLTYLRLTHRFYLSKKLPEIEQTVVHIFNKYNHSHKMLVYLCIFFCDYKKKLEEHINFEEKKLFPYIQKLTDLENANETSENVFMVLNSFSAKAFIQNHTQIEDDLQEVRKTILKYTESKATPLPYRVFLSQLQYFEVELCKHAMLEDNVLIPKVIELEAALLKKAASATLNKLNFS